MTDLETIRNAGRTQVMGVLNITEDSSSNVYPKRMNWPGSVVLSRR